MSYFPGSEPPLIRWAGKIGAFFGLSILWILCCLPVLTIMPASIAMYDSVVWCVHGDEPGPFRRFFATLRAELLRGVCLSLMWIVVWAVFIYGFGILNALSKENPVFSVYSIIYTGSMLIPLAMMVWIIPLQARFQYGFFELHRIAMSFVILHFPTTAAVIGMLLAAVTVSIVVLPMLVLIPAILVTLQSAMIEKVLDEYEDEEL